MKAQSKFLNLLVMTLMLVIASGFLTSCKKGGGGGSGDECIDDQNDFAETIGPQPADAVICEGDTETYPATIEEAGDFFYWVAFQATSAGTYDIVLSDYTVGGLDPELLSDLTLNDADGFFLPSTPEAAPAGSEAISRVLEEDDIIVIEVYFSRDPGGDSSGAADVDTNFTLSLEKR